VGKKAFPSQGEEVRNGSAQGKREAHMACSKILVISRLAEERDSKKEKKTPIGPIPFMRHLVAACEKKKREIERGSQPHLRCWRTGVGKKQLNFLESRWDKNAVSPRKDIRDTGGAKGNGTATLQDLDLGLRGGGQKERTRGWTWGRRSMNVGRYLREKMARAERR